MLLSVYRCSFYTSLVGCPVRILFILFVKQKTAYEMRISDWSSDVCSSDLGTWRTALWGAMPLGSLIGGLLARGGYSTPLIVGATAGLMVSAVGHRYVEIGRASCRESVCQYV